MFIAYGKIKQEEEYVCSPKMESHHITDAIMMVKVWFWENSFDNTTSHAIFARNDLHSEYACIESTPGAEEEIYASAFT